MTKFLLLLSVLFSVSTFADDEIFCSDSDFSKYLRANDITKVKLAIDKCFNLDLSKYNDALVRVTMSNFDQELLDLLKKDPTINFNIYIVSGRDRVNPITWLAKNKKYSMLEQLIDIESVNVNDERFFRSFIFDDKTFPEALFAKIITLPRFDISHFEDGKSNLFLRILSNNAHLGRIVINNNILDKEVVYNYLCEANFGISNTLFFEVLQSDKTRINQGCKGVSHPLNRFYYGDLARAKWLLTQPELDLSGNHVSAQVFFRMVRRMTGDDDDWKSPFEAVLNHPTFNGESETYAGDNLYHLFFREARPFYDKSDSILDYVMTLLKKYEDKLINKQNNNGNPPIFKLIEGDNLKHFTRYLFNNSQIDFKKNFDITYKDNRRSDSPVVKLKSISPMLFSIMRSGYDDKLKYLEAQLGRPDYIGELNFPNKEYNPISNMIRLSFKRKELDLWKWFINLEGVDFNAVLKYTSYSEIKVGNIMRIFRNLNLEDKDEAKENRNIAFALSMINELTLKPDFNKDYLKDVIMLARKPIVYAAKTLGFEDIFNLFRNLKHRENFLIEAYANTIAATMQEQQFDLTKELILSGEFNHFNENSKQRIFKDSLFYDKTGNTSLFLLREKFHGDLIISERDDFDYFDRRDNLEFFAKVLDTNNTELIKFFVPIYKNYVNDTVETALDDRKWSRVKTLISTPYFDLSKLSPDDVFNHNNRRTKAEVFVENVFSSVKIRKKEDNLSFIALVREFLERYDVKDIENVAEKLLSGNNFDINTVDEVLQPKTKTAMFPERILKFSLLNYSIILQEKEIFEYLMSRKDLNFKNVFSPYYTFVLANYLYVDERRYQYNRDYSSSYVDSLVKSGKLRLSFGKIEGKTLSAIVYEYKKRADDKVVLWAPLVPFMKYTRFKLSQEHFDLAHRNTRFSTSRYSPKNGYILNLDNFRAFYSHPGNKKPIQYSSFLKFLISGKKEVLKERLEFITANKKKFDLSISIERENPVSALFDNLRSEKSVLDFLVEHPELVLTNRLEEFIDDVAWVRLDQVKAAQVIVKNKSDFSKEELKDAFREVLWDYGRTNKDEEAPIINALVNIYGPLNDLSGSNSYSELFDYSIKLSKPALTNQIIDSFDVDANGSNVKTNWLKIIDYSIENNRLDLVKRILPRTKSLLNKSVAYLTIENTSGSRGSYGLDLMGHIVSKKDTDLLKYFVDLGLPLNTIKDSCRRCVTAIGVAYEKNWVEGVEYLLNKQVNPHVFRGGRNWQHNQEITVFHQYFEHIYDLDKLKFYYSMGGDPNLYSPLIDAIMKEDLLVTQLLLMQPGLDINQGKNTNALIEAVKLENVDLVKELLNIPGIDTEKRDSDNRSASEWAVTLGNREIYDLIVKYEQAN